MDLKPKYYILNILINNNSELMQYGTPAFCGWDYNFPSIVEFGLFDTRLNIKSDLSYVLSTREEISP